MNRNIKLIAFGIATGIFLWGVEYIWMNRNTSPMNITHFAALEYCGIYIYTIYDKLNKDNHG